MNRGSARPSPRPRPTADAVRRAAELLAGADRPLIIAGGGAVDAQTELTALAEALGAPVATTVNGKGTLDEAHPLSVGASVRLRALQKAAADSDALLVVGTELGDSDLWEGQIRGRGRHPLRHRPAPSWTRTARPTMRCSATPPPR